MARFVGFVLFLVFIQDQGCAYSQHIAAPFGWLQFLMVPTFVKIRPFDMLMLYALFAGAGSKAPLVRPMRSALYVALGATLFAFFYGMIHGGEFRFASWQIYLILSAILTAFAVARACRTPAHFAQLGKWLVAAGAYRAAMCWISYFTWAKGIVGESGAFLTEHADTITWVVSILVLLVNGIEQRSTAVWFRNGLLILFFLGAIQFNSRRLAWVSLAMGVAILYVVVPPGKAKRRVTRAALALSPLVLMYVVVGWGRPERIFLPLHSLSTVSTQEDASTLARNAENLGLIATAGYTNIIFGSGWGRPYVALTMKYDISSFELWRYVPHNSVLGLLAFSGILGFTGVWLPLPTSVFFNARVARGTADPIARSVALVGASQLIVCCNQFYGDMGMFTPQAMYAMAVSYAMALRLPPISGVWGPLAAGAPVRKA